MQTQSLSGAWRLRQADGEDWLPAVVPGGTYTDLLAAGRIEDPFDRENEKLVQWVAERDWEYRREFEVAAELLAEERVELVCEGLDTLAEVRLNGAEVGRGENMFRCYRWEVKEHLKVGPNQISIHFRSPEAAIAAREKARPLPAMMNRGMAHLRKAQSHFGWDWGPRLAVSGIWREIALEGYSAARWLDVQVRQQHADGQVRLEVTAACENWGKADLILRLALKDPDGRSTHTSALVKAGRAAVSLEVPDPQLWWPNGLGAQPLYQLEVDLLGVESGLKEDRLLDQRAFQLGLRRLELRQDPDQWGQTFTFVVNGVPIFARGANWIPADSFPARLTGARYEALIRDAAAAQMNMLRVWGGGYYEDEHFYDLCDRYGLLVWQDFMFACAAYPLDEAEFLENVRLEVRDNVRRLRHRACLALWSGNNEIEMMWGLWKRNQPLTAACERFFYRQLPEWLAAADPEHAYWPSSPSSGTFMKATNGDARGDTHLWQVWHGLKPFNFFRTRLTRFASEFGLEALPALETIAGFARPEEYDLRASVLLHHQRSVGGNDKMLYYLLERFRLPRDFSDLVYLTQILQAECIRVGVEHWRRSRPRCSGALYWQLNDCWPVTSWASIDYYGRWKALQYAARRFNAPLALSLEDKGSRVGVYAPNDAPGPWHGELRWQVETLSGEALESGSQAATAQPVSASRLKIFDFAAQFKKMKPENLVFWAELWDGPVCAARQVLLFAAEKEIDLPDPQLSAELALQGDTLVVTVSARGLARFVALGLEGADVVFSDNFFDLPAGRSQRVTCPLPGGWTLEMARQALRLRSLAGIAPAGSRASDRLLQAQINLKPLNLFMRAMFAMMK